MARKAWVIEDAARIHGLLTRLDTRNWQSLSVLPSCNPTRIIVEMGSGKVWEICISTASQPKLGVFERNDRGWSGQLPYQAAFFNALAQAIEADTGQPVDLHANFRTAYRTGYMRQVVPAETEAVLKTYPGYPEVIWNPDSQAFEYRQD